MIVLGSDKNENKEMITMIKKWNDKFTIRILYKPFITEVVGHERLTKSWDGRYGALYETRQHIIIELFYLLSFIKQANTWLLKHVSAPKESHIFCNVGCFQLRKGYPECVTIFIFPRPIISLTPGLAKHAILTKQRGHFAHFCPNLVLCEIFLGAREHNL